MEVPVARVPSRPTFSRPPFAPAPRAAHAPFPRAQLSAPAGARAVGVGTGARGPVGVAGGPRSAVRAGAGPRAARDVRSAEPRRRPAPDELLPNAVLVTGYPPYTKPQDLAHAFCKFGSVRLNHDWITDTAACLEFSQPDHAQAAIRASRDVNVYGTFLTVTACTVNTRPHRQPRRREPRVGKAQTFKGTIVEPSKIPLQGAFHQQLDALLSAVRLTQPEIERLSHLYRDLEYVLSEIWPGCRAVPFGSVTTGLGVKSSDADCFVALPRGAARAGAVGRARRALQAHPGVFGELLAIPRANTPIVKFIHVPTGVSCDLSFKTPLGSQNSKLISFLLFSDPRLIPVAVAVKYWARVHDLTGTGKLTNYALTMMIIFFFQQAPISVLPAVEWLQRDRGYDCFVDYWNTGFVNDLRRIPRSTDTSSVAELLGGFFEYYANFDFERLVVCPFLGRTVKKDDFRDLALLPEEFFLYKKNVSEKVTLPIRFMTSMCVQDPFEQCHNVASAVSSRLAADIRAYFKFAADAYEREKLKDYSGLLPTILLEKPELPRAKKGGSEFRARLPPGLIGNIVAANWKTVVRDVAFQVFESILRVELQKVEDENDKQTETIKRGNPSKLGEASNETRSTKGRNLVTLETAKSGKVAIPEKSANPVNKSEDTFKSEESTKCVNEIATLEGTVTLNAHNEASKPEETPKDEGKKRVSESKEKPKVEIIKNGRLVGGITRREKERYTGAITRAIWKRKTFNKLYSVMGLKFLDRETMITDEIMKVDKNVIDIKFQVLLTFINAPRSAVVSIRNTAGDLNAFKEFGKFFNNTFQHWFVILYKPYCKKPLQNAGTENRVPTGTDEEAAAKELNEAIKAEKNDISDSDSDSDFSYEDERIDPNATNSEDVVEREESTKLSDTDKNSKNRSNIAVQKQSENVKKCDTQENYDNKIRTDEVHDEDELNPSDKSPRKRKNKTQHTEKNKDQQINHLNDIVGALNLVDKSPRKINTPNHDINAHVQTVADDQNEGNESQNKPPHNRSRTPHGDHNGTCLEIPKTKSPRHRHRKGKDKPQSALTEESGRTRSAGENGQTP